MARVYNIISILFLLLTIGIVGFGVIRMMAPPPVVVTAEAEIPTPQVLPTVTTTYTPTNTLIPTWTPTWTETATPSITPTNAPTIPTSTPVPPTVPPTDTPIPPTAAPSSTITETSTITVTASDTPPASPTYTPTGPTPVPPTVPSPFPFTLRNNQVSFTANFANTAGCQWQGMGGAVFDLAGQPFPGLRVHVYGGGTPDLYTATGTNSLYGQGSGWELAVSNAISAATYYVELQSQEGTVISPTVQITFPGSCQGNLAVINFEQTRPLN